MRKLKLEALTVESFETAGVPQERGTVEAHAKPRPTTLNTYNVDACGDTNYFDCTLGCSLNTNCAGACGVSDFGCVQLTEADCV